MDDSRNLHILLAGTIGCGKSATANTLCGEYYFQSKYSRDPVTKQSQTKLVINVKDHTKINVVDAPALFDIHNDDKESVSREFKKCIDLAYPGIDILLMVVSLDRRFTADDKILFEKYEHFFGERIRNNMMILFSHKEKLQNVPLNKYLETNRNDALISYMKRYYNSFWAIDNTQNIPEQREQIIEKLFQMKREHGHKPYTHKDLDVWTKQKEEEMKIKVGIIFQGIQKEIEKEKEKNRKILSRGNSEKKKSEVLYSRFDNQDDSLAEGKKCSLKIDSDDNVSDKKTSLTEDEKESIDERIKKYQYCTVCKTMNVATNYCRDCEPCGLLCKNCIDFHNKVGSVSEHFYDKIGKSDDMEGETEIKNSDKIYIPSKCQFLDHGKLPAMVQYFCYECTSYLCSECEDNHWKVPALKNHCIDRVIIIEKDLYQKNQNSSVTANNKRKDYCLWKHHESSRIATLICLDCDSLLLCEECVNNHKQFPNCTDHNVVDRSSSSDFTENKMAYDTPQRCQVCDSHNPVTTLCFNCQILICDTCCHQYKRSGRDLKDHLLINLVEWEKNKGIAKFIDQRTAHRKLLTAVICFGTSTIDLMVSFNNDFSKGTTSLFHTSGVVLFEIDERLAIDERFIAFGNDALDKWNMLNSAEQSSHWHLWEEFLEDSFTWIKIRTMKKRKRTKFLKLNGKRLKHINVIVARAIMYCQRYLLSILKRHLVEVNDELISWVVKVPSFWDEDCKQTIKEKIKQVGMENSMVLLVNEHDAALNFIIGKHVLTEIITQHKRLAYVYSADQTIMVSDVELRGDDFVVKKQIIGLAEPMFKSILATDYGSNLMNHLNPDDLIYLTTEFEKNVLTYSKGNIMEIFLPVTIMELFCRRIPPGPLTDSDRNMHLKDNKLVLKASYIECLILERTACISKLICELLETKEHPLPVILQGSFFDSKKIQSQVKVDLKDKNCINCTCVNELVNSHVLEMIFYGLAHGKLLHGSEPVVSFVNSEED